VSDEVRGDAQLLMRVVDSERDLGAAKLGDDVPCATDDHLSSAFGKECHQCYVTGEVYIEKKFDFALAEAAFWGEEAPIKHLLAESSNGGEHFGAIVWLERPDLQNCPLRKRSVAANLEASIDRRPRSGPSDY
jgi:hypothetical protein